MTAVERRRRIIFDSKLDRLGDVRPGNLGHEVECEIDPRSDTGSGDDVAVSDDAARLIKQKTANLAQVVNDVINLYQIKDRGLSGSGQKLFEDGTQTQMFRLVYSLVGESGIILATYEPGGEVKPGRMDE